MAPLINIEGIGPALTEKFREAGIRTTEALLKAGGAPEGRQELAAKVGVDAGRLLRWVNRAVELPRFGGQVKAWDHMVWAAASSYRMGER